MYLKTAITIRIAQLHSSGDVLEISRAGEPLYKAREIYLGDVSDAVRRRLEKIMVECRMTLSEEIEWYAPAAPFEDKFASVDLGNINEVRKIVTGEDFSQDY